jgi:hypothetical protein
MKTPPMPLVASEYVTLSAIEDALSYVIKPEGEADVR